MDKISLIYLATLGYFLTDQPGQVAFPPKTLWAFSLPKNTHRVGNAYSDGKYIFYYYFYLGENRRIRKLLPNEI